MFYNATQIKYFRSRLNKIVDDHMKRWKSKHPTPKSPTDKDRLEAGIKSALRLPAHTIRKIAEKARTNHYAPLGEFFMDLPDAEKIVVRYRGEVNAYEEAEAAERRASELRADYIMDQIHTATEDVALGLIRDF